LVGKTEGRRSLGRNKRRWKNIIEVDLPEIIPEVLTVIDLA